MKRCLVLLALMTIAFVSCRKDNDNPPVPTLNRVAISPVVTLPTHSDITRATELSFEQGDAVGVSIIKDDRTIYTDNARLTYADNVFTGDVVWYEGTDASTVAAYYPYSEAGMPTAFSVSTDQTTGYGASDLMAAVKSDVTPANGAVSMTFKHLLSKIVINVKQSDESINSIVLQNSIPVATVDLENLTAVADQSAAVADITAQVVTANSVYRAVVVPQTVSLSIAVSSQSKTFTHKLSSATIKSGGQYSINIEILNGEMTVVISGDIENWKDEDEIDVEVIDPNPEGATAYITKVFDFMPAVGQFTNKLPAYVTGDTQATMNQKVLDAIGNNNKGMISLGGFGGYVVVGFDHTIANVAGKRDFRVLGNAFFAAANPNPGAPEGGSCEPGVIMVSFDANKNGKPDDPWYEIAGSAHEDPTRELWYQMAVDNGNDVSLYRNYSITYYRPESEPASSDDWDTYIRWTDNKGNSGYKVKNQYHSQSYYPLWAEGNTLTFDGTCLPQNGIDESGQGNYFVLYKFRYGYADNDTNISDGSTIDIDWAVNAAGEKVKLPGVDFIKIYTGVNQENGWLGECSTEIMGVDDLHVLGIDIDTQL